MIIGLLGGWLGRVRPAAAVVVSEVVGLTKLGAADDARPVEDEGGITIVEANPMVRSWPPRKVAYRVKTTHPCLPSSSPGRRRLKVAW